MRNQYCIANWKMNQSISDCRNFIDYINSNIKYSNSKMIICPSNIHLSLMHSISENSELIIGAQTVSEFKNGAYTGETSCEMLLDSGINWTILGHSERRQYFNETNEVILNKLRNVIEHKINPILCIGESLENRKAGKTVEVLKSQIESACSVLDFSDVEMVIAYEPVWAIGTGVAADIDTISETHNQIRNFLPEYLLNSENTSILYGGSVNPDNCQNILDIENVDGFLIGGASLSPQKFLNIYTQMNEIGVKSL